MTSATERYPLPANVTALCCVCGTAREVSRWMWTISGNRRLKCATCKAMTMHALVSDRDDCGDWREEANLKQENCDHIWDRAGTQPPLPSRRS